MQSRRGFGGLGQLAGHAAIGMGGGDMKALGGGAKWGANKAYGSYHNTHGGAKASAKHDIATARYKEQLQAKAAAKSGNSGNTDAGSAVTPVAAGGAAGRDGRDGKDGARGERGERGFAGKDGSAASQPTQTSSTNKGGKQS